MGEQLFTRSSTMKVIILAVMVSMVLGTNVPVEQEAEASVQPEVREFQMSENEDGPLLKEVYGEEDVAGEEDLAEDGRVLNEVFEEENPAETEKRLSMSTLESSISYVIGRYANKGDSNRYIASKVKNVLKSDYKGYHFLVIVYKGVSGFKKHTISGNCRVHKFRHNNKNIVVYYRRKYKASATRRWAMICWGCDVWYAWSSPAIKPNRVKWTNMNKFDIPGC